MAIQRGFYECLQTVKSLRAGPDCRYQLNSELESLLLYRYHQSVAPPAEDIEDVLVTCVRLVSPSYVQLISKMAQLVHRTLGKNPLILSKAAFEDVMAFTMTAIQTEWTVADGLKALAGLLHRHTQFVSPKYIDLLASSNTSKLGCLFRLAQDRENIAACSAAVQCIGLLVQKASPQWKAVLDDAALAFALTTLLQCLQQSTAALPENPQEIQICTACVQALLIVWPLVKGNGERDVPVIIGQCKTLLDLTCGNKDPDRSRTTPAGPPRHCVAPPGQGVKKPSASGGTPLDTPVFSTSDVNSLKSAGMTMEIGSASANSRGPGVTHGPRRRRKKKKREKKGAEPTASSEGANATTATDDTSAHPVGKTGRLDSDEDSDGGDIDSRNLAREMAHSVLAAETLSPVPTLSQATPAAITKSCSPVLTQRRSPTQMPSATLTPPHSVSAIPRNVVESASVGTSSDSETSDIESSRKRTSPHHAEEELELSTLLLLDQVLSVLHRKAAFSYWPTLFPDVTASSRGPLFSIALASLCVKSRGTALMVAGKLLDGSRQYLLLADDTQATQRSHWAFTSLSQTLGSILSEVYKHLVQLLDVRRELSNEVHIQAIKCLSLFVWNAPFHRLRAGYLSGVVAALEPLLTRRDVTVRTACLTCLGAVVCVHAPLDEVVQVLRPAVLTKGLASSLQAMTPDFQDSTSEVTSSSATDGDGLSDWKIVRHLDGRGGVVVGDRPVLLERTPSSSSRSNAASEIGSSVATPPSDVGGNGRFMRSESTPPPSSRCKASASTVLTCGPFPWLSFVNRLDDLAENSVLFPSGSSWLCRLTAHLIVSKGLPRSNPAYQVRPQSLRSPPPSTYRQKLVIRTEALQVLFGFAHNYFQLARNNWRSLVCLALEVAGPSSDEAIQLHSIKLLATILQHVGDSAGDEENGSSSGTEVGARATSSIVSIKELSELWQLLLDLLLLPSLHQEDGAMATVRSAVLDCVATVHPLAFHQITPGSRDTCLGLVKKSCEDSNQISKCSAVRTLGLFFTHPELRRAPSFLRSCTGVVCSVLDDPVLVVRAKGSWAFGNLAEAMMRNMEESLPLDSEHVSGLLSQSIKAACDHDRVKAGAVRAVGCLIRCLGCKDLGTASMVALVESGMRQLTKVVSSSSITAKVRWNSCYGIRTALSNPDLDVGSTSWAESMFNALLAVAQKHKNFKVRIGATAALVAPQQRSAFGGPALFLGICTSAILALESCGTLTDFGDLRYKDTLRRQLCVVVLHLISLATETDANTLALVVMDKCKIIQLAIADCSRKDDNSTATAQDAHGGNEQDDAGEEKNDTAGSMAGTVGDRVEGLRRHLSQLQAHKATQNGSNGAGSGGCLQRLLAAILEPVDGKSAFPFQADYT